MMESTERRWHATSISSAFKVSALVAVGVLAFLGSARAQGHGGASRDDGGKGPIPEEFRVKREAVYEFGAKPAVTRDGDKVTITFASKGWCDATVAVENERGGIVRHLASGVLGKNAPPPFQKNSLKQTLVWDSKSDLGRYVDDKDALTVRVSLGLNPRFERTHYWSPHKRVSNMAPLLAATPEGVYVFQGLGVDHLMLFDHEGRYVRTIYPFPSDKIGQVKELQQKTYPHDGKTLPLKIGFNQSTMLSSGSSGRPADTGGHYGGIGASAMAVRGKRIALAHLNLNRLSTDGSSGGLPIKGPRTCILLGKGKHAKKIGPTSMAFSPDGKWLYLTGYVWNRDVRTGDCRHGVYRMAYEGNKPPEIFLGQNKSDGGHGRDNAHFTVPTSVDVDTKGRIYVSDFINSRIQVFAAEGKYLKTLPTKMPARVVVDPLSGEILAFSWLVIGPSSRVLREAKLGHIFARHARRWSTLARLGTFDKPVAGKAQNIAAGQGERYYGSKELGGQSYQATVDPWGKTRTAWVVGRRPTADAAEMNWSGGVGVLSQGSTQGIRLLVEKGGAWVVSKSFAKLTQKKVIRVKRSDFSRQRLYFDPAREKLYVGEDAGFCKSFDEVIVIDPRTGRLKKANLPFDAEDMCFDLEGRAYLRTDREIVRFDPKTWREIPWDYGEERRGVHYQGFHAPRRSVNAVGALAIPGRRPVDWHIGGMAISPKGHLAVLCMIKPPVRKKALGGRGLRDVRRKYRPRQYPGRLGNFVVHIWDRHGKLVHEDAIPGFVGSDGLGIDQADDLYAMVAAPRVLDGKPYSNSFTETLMKLRPGRSRFVSSSSRAPIVLGENAKPKRTADLSKAGALWVENAEWVYGGVGYGGQTGSCVCWYSRFTLDYLNRSFVPELERYRVAVLDSAGNLILRIGRYGNVDDGRPLIPVRGPEAPRALGGDEVALMHAAYLGIHTDRRLFIHDAGNGRILSVTLGYHAQETVALKDVPGRKR